MGKKVNTDNIWVEFYQDKSDEKKWRWHMVEMTGHNQYDVRQLSPDTFDTEEEAREVFHILNGHRWKILN